MLAGFVRGVAGIGTTPAGELHDTLREVVAHFPVYRTYVHPRRPPTEADRRHVGAALAAARAGGPISTPS